MYLCRHFFHADMAKPTLFTEYKERGRSHMWYVIQVRTGTEREIIRQCQTVIPKETLEKSFLPCFEEMKRYQGAWHKEQKLLFPGYVFLISGDPEQLYRSLKPVIGLTKLLKTGDQIISLTEPEIQFLLRFGGTEQLVKMSTGFVEQDQIIILDGPLKGMEGYIKKIDRHRREASLELPMFGRILDVKVGLEIIGKK
ncbi:antiterminator LoaP [Candidatus Merdisoma sp. JLR.KK011]|uniref:antiterminator LoaP n=1 Tax=Candidatus Merdisoma sp. JLR.KK011 TaxID=3114299 RepID=UPI002FF15AF0